MPYDPESGAEVARMKAKLKKTYSSVSDKDARQAIHILNSMMEDGKDEGAAWGAIHSQLQKKGLGKKAGFVNVPSNIARAVANSLAKLIREAEIPLEDRQKATHFRDLTSNSGHGSLRTKWVDERIWSEGDSFIYGVDDYDEQNERVENLESEANDLLIRMGVIGRRAKVGTMYSFERSASLAESVNRLATKHPKHAKALQAIAKEAMGWVPGELREDKIWETGMVDDSPTSHVEEGSQVPPARDSYGDQLDADGNPVESIERVASVEDSWNRLANRIRGLG